MSENEPVLLRIHLRGGQTIEKVVTGCEVRTVIGDLGNLSYASADDVRLPYLRLSAVDAVTIHPAPPSVADDRT